jgi:hypothetical protein
MENNKLMEDLAALEEYKGPPKVSCKDLTAAEGYPITSLKRMDSRFGASIVAEITMPGGEPAITFLPQRFVDQLTNAQIEVINKGGFRMRSTGMTGRSINLKIY